MNRAEGRVERWPWACISMSVSRTHGIDRSRHRMDIRHHGVPRACAGHGHSSEGSLQGIDTPGRACADGDSSQASVTHDPPPVFLCTPVLCVSSKHGQLSVPSGDRTQQGKSWWVNQPDQLVQGSPGWGQSAQGLLWGRHQRGRSWEAGAEVATADVVVTRVGVCTRPHSANTP